MKFEQMGRRAVASEILIEIILKSSNRLQYFLDYTGLEK